MRRVVAAITPRPPWVALLWLACFTAAPALASPAAAQERWIDFTGGIANHNDEAIGVASRLVIAPGVGPKAIQPFTVHVHASATLEYAADAGLVPRAQVTVAATQPLMQRDNAFTSLVVRTSAEGTTSGQQGAGADLLTWFATDRDEFWIQASLERDRDGALSRSVAATFSRTIHRQLEAYGGFTYSATKNTSDVRASHGLVYHAAPGRSVDFTCYHVARAVPACTVTFAITTR